SKTIFSIIRYLNSFFLIFKRCNYRNRAKYFFLNDSQIVIFCFKQCWLYPVAILIFWLVWQYVLSAITSTKDHFCFFFTHLQITNHFIILGLIRYWSHVVIRI